MSLDPISITVTVRCAPAQAFAAFTSRVGNWWPSRTFSISAGRLGKPSLGIQMGEEVGGRIEETDAEGACHHWGTITRWDPPHAIAFEWHVGRGPETASHVSVTFDPTDDGRTVVQLVQSNWQALGDAAAEMRTRNLRGWSAILNDGFAAYVHA